MMEAKRGAEREKGRGRKESIKRERERERNAGGMEKERRKTRRYDNHNVGDTHIATCRVSAEAPLHLGPWAQVKKQGCR